MKIRLLILLSILTFSACNGKDDYESTPSRTVQSELPIKRVVLYQNGVAYIERSGKFTGKVLSLRIRHDQVQDILKTLTVIDKSGGHAVAISLPVEKNQLAKMAELPPQVRRNGGLLAIAMAFRGAMAKVETSDDTYRGRIVGVENFGNDKENKYRLTLLRNGKLLVISMDKINSLKVLDKTLTIGLEKSLDISLNKGTWKPINLAINLSHAGSHNLIVSYVVEMPIWKPAYRLVVGDNGKEILLQGWSVVDNLSGDDWRNVYLSLTAGTPLAFRYDLYTPHSVQRPDLTPAVNRVSEAPPAPVDATADDSEMDAAPAPASKSLSMDDSKKDYSRRPKRSRGKYYSRPIIKNELSEAPRMEISDMRRSFKTLVSGASVGSLFRYDIKSPVTVPDRSSALVTLINKDVEGEDVLYFISESSDRVPYRAIRFKNKSGYVLEKGPIAIYRKGQFVGEALGGVIEKNATAFVPYAREGKIHIHVAQQWLNEGERLLKISNGNVVIEERNIYKYVYEIENRTGEEFTLYIRRNRRSGWNPANSKSFIFEKDIYYVPVKLKTGKNKTEIREETPVRRTYGLYYYKTHTYLKLFIKSPDLPGALKDKLKEVLDIYEEITQVKLKMEEISRSRSVLNDQQYEDRRNLEVLGKTGNNDLRRKLLKRIEKIADDLSKLNREWVELNMKKGEKERRMYALFKMISFTAPSK
ncbi:DUF4139 domain-containing protein [Myxococcota bacterium]|nr:DUF4139 domain-containing protein [Myxococcota bacterium]MBU1379438.1 DUF4139 domain-containing protein [Myxococcota bacterium]MBU1497640.1 DUF4139 domain-containing protein [Myxococcota bacterium]